MFTIVLSQQVQALLHPDDHTMGYVAAGAAFGASGLLIWMQRSRSLRGAETKFSRNLLTLVGLLALSGLAALALLPAEPQLFLGFLGTMAGYMVGRNHAALDPPGPSATAINTGESPGL